MELFLARSMWGIDAPLEQSLPNIKAAGYALIENGNHGWDDAYERRYSGLCQEHGLGIIAMGFTQGATVAEHVATFREHIESAKRIGCVQMTVHSGQDAFSDAEADAFYREVAAIEKDVAFPVGHETHRGRVFFSPWRTRDVLLKFPSLKLCVDFSHWVCVAERLDWDDDAGSILKLCADRAIHLHARVGYEEGPQVPHPAAPEYAKHVDRHFDWWQTIWAAQAAAGRACTITAEFGPAGYLHTLPFTNVPVAVQAEVCEWMAVEVRRRSPK